MRIDRVRAVLAAVALTAIAGCQSGEAVLSREEYVEQGNAICTDMNAEIMAAATGQGGEWPPAGPEGDALFQTVMTSIGGALDELDALEGPADMVAEMDAIAAEARTIRTAVETEGAEAFFATDEDPWEAINPRFEALGLTACAEDPTAE